MAPLIAADDHAQLVEAFVVETEEILVRLEELLLRLEQTPDDDELLHEIFRGAHTVKGNAACLGFDEMTAFANVVEELLERLRNREIHATPATVSRLLDDLDGLRELAARAVAGEGTLTPLRRSAAQTLRVSIQKLDRMLDLTGEIAVARGHVRQVIAQNDSRERILDSVRDLDRLSFDLQELIMDARLVPLGAALRPFQRVVRDVAAARQKRVTLTIEAGDVEVDTTVIEQLKDPITHMLRNAIDHGVEDAETRLAQGKSPAGTIRIAAAHENGGIVIRISDDGRGLDEQSIARRARAMGLDVERISRQKLLNLIFEPGFTTADAVTDISGRGVGMDVVRRNVEALRGAVAVASESGEGTIITVRLPLTVTVIEGFAVAVADETYVLPIECVVECTALPDEASGDAVGVLNVRGEALPFLRLRNLFGLEETAVQRENVVIVQHGDGRAGIVVDSLLGGSETVMKPMGGLLRRLPGVAGSSILGNGRVALVLDAREVVRRAAESQQHVH
jgi:two-component system, chemotaxis family, sensor kinase CheA